MESNDRVVERFDLSHVRLPLIGIFKDPEDYPGQFVARLWSVDQPTRYIILADSLAEIRQHIPSGMLRIQRESNDDPCIIEVWI